jgi:hypothetical protein
MKKRDFLAGMCCGVWTEGYGFAFQSLLSSRIRENWYSLIAECYNALMVRKKT